MVKKDAPSGERHPPGLEKSRPAAVGAGSLNLAQKKSPRPGDCHRLPQFKIATTGRFGRCSGIARPVAALGTSPGKAPSPFSLQYLRQII